MCFRPSVAAAGLVWSCLRGHRTDGPERGPFKHSTHQSPQTGPPPRGTLHRCPASAAVTFWWGVRAGGKSTSQGEHHNTRARRDSPSMFCLRAFDRPSTMSPLRRHTRSVLVYSAVSEGLRILGIHTWKLCPKGVLMEQSTNMVKKRFLTFLIWASF